MMSHWRESVEKMARLGRAGLTVSICCGPAPDRFRWSVQVLSRTGQEFDQPFAAFSFTHAVTIAERESLNRGWITHEELQQAYTDIREPVG